VLDTVTDNVIVLPAEVTTFPNPDQATMVGGSTIGVG
jgi:hypothetical protein